MTETLKWYEKSGLDGDVVLSTRVRLARNLTAFPFPSRASMSQKQEIEKKVNQALMSASSVMSGEFAFVPLKALSREAAVSLAERHIVSPGFISDVDGKAVLLSKDESISIMINEEDHLRIQVIKEGLMLEEALNTAQRLDNLLSEQLDFAFDENLGYLTQCPTNLGTALRASLMLHLPALTEYNIMPRMSVNLSKLGLTIRGTYGEGSAVDGAIYQLSNQVTLGLSEKTAIDNLSAIAKQLITEERVKRLDIISNIEMQDRIYRAAGILKSARTLSSNEFMKLISYIRLGISGGLIGGISFGDINRLATQVQPATLMAAGQAELSQVKRDRLRADMVREVLNKSFNLDSTEEE